MKTNQNQGTDYVDTKKPHYCEVDFSCMQTYSEQAADFPEKNYRFVSVQRIGLLSELPAAKRVVQLLQECGATDISISTSHEDDTQRDIDFTITYTTATGVVNKPTFSVKAFNNAHKYRWDIPFKYGALQGDREVDRWWSYGKATNYLFIIGNSMLCFNSKKLHDIVDNHGNAIGKTDNYGNKEHATKDTENLNKRVPLADILPALSIQQPLMIDLPNYKNVPLWSQAPAVCSILQPK